MKSSCEAQVSARCCCNEGWLCGALKVTNFDASMGLQKLASRPRMATIVRSPSEILLVCELLTCHIAAHMLT